MTAHVAAITLGMGRALAWSCALKAGLPSGFARLEHRLVAGQKPPRRLELAGFRGGADGPMGERPKGIYKQLNLTKARPLIGRGFRQWCKFQCQHAAQRAIRACLSMQSHDR